MGGYVYAALFWFKAVNWYLIEDSDEQKADIVKYVFQRYASGLIRM